MTDIQIIPASNYKCMPWKNGLGSTLEVKRYDDSNGQRFRISKATVVEDGLFSDFTGQHRTLVLLSGEGMTLKHKCQNHHSSHRLINNLDIARFSGGDETYATLDNNIAIEDLNIMVREKDTLAKVVAIRADQSLTPTKVASTLLSAFYANCDCMIDLRSNIDEEKTIRLVKGSFLCFKDPRTLINKTIIITKGNGVFIEVLDDSDTSHKA
jgi:environmental stress-induced protein Ves